MITEQVWRTENLPVAAFIHATRALKFLRCEPAGRPGILQFVFGDPNDQGDDLELSYDSGAKVVASAHFSAIRAMRTAMTKTTTNTFTGATHVRNYQPTR
jgi:hypothetical protein